MSAGKPSNSPPRSYRQSFVLAVIAVYLPAIVPLLVVALTEGGHDVATCLGFWYAELSTPWLIGVLGICFALTWLEGILGLCIGCWLHSRFFGHDSCKVQSTPESRTSLPLVTCCG